MSVDSRNRVSLIGDTDHPYISFQHIAGYHKALGDTVGLNLSNPNIVYISCIFKWNKARMLGIAKLYESLGCKVFVGGSGIDVTKKLPPEIEKAPLDLTLYSNLDYAFGFITRGCIRNCKPYCIVPEKEGMLSYIGYDWVWKDKVIFYDNNFLGYTDHEDVLKILIEKGWKVCFNQALDIRLVNKSNGELLKQLLYYDRKFKHRRIYFAFDNPAIEPIVREKVALLNKIGIPSSHMLFYMIYGVEDNPSVAFASAWHRYKVLKELKCLPYPMNYRKGDKRYKECHKLATFAIMRYDRVCQFENFDHRIRSKRHIDVNVRVK